MAGDLQLAFDLVGLDGMYQLQDDRLWNTRFVVRPFDTSFYCLGIVPLSLICKLASNAGTGLTVLRTVWA